MKVLPFLAALAFASPVFAAPQFSTIYTFPPQKSGDGDYPYAPLTAGPDGSLYGITAFVGKYSGGVIFKLTPSGAQWTYQELYKLKKTEGGIATGKMIFDQDTGALIGTTSYGGGIFRLAPPAVDGDPWTFAMIRTFTGEDGDGFGPYGGMTQDPATGAIYGTTAYFPTFGGPTDWGHIYGFTPDASHQNWTQILDYEFPAPPAGNDPHGDLLLKDGILYGTTVMGGPVTGECSEGCGTIFSFDPATSTFKTLFTSSGTPQPFRFDVGTPVLDDASNFIGTSLGGGGTNCKFDSCGTVYAMPLDGSAAPTVIAALQGKKAGGLDAGVIWDATHTTLYGTTVHGLPNICHYHSGLGDNGKDGCGNVFKLTLTGKKWKYTLIHAFDGKDDGAEPNQLVLGSDGALYGTTGSGGANKTGTVFRIDP